VAVDRGEREPADLGELMNRVGLQAEEVDDLASVRARQRLEDTVKIDSEVSRRRSSSFRSACRHGVATSGDT
jgi:hypothetical protein